MNTRNVVLASLLAIPTVFAQETIKPGQARGFASEVRASAAQAQFNSIRLQMVLMFKDLYAKHPLEGASAEEQAMINDAEDEILRLIAAQLESLMETYEGVDVVQTAAVAVLARIQTKLGDFDGAIATLEEFDAEAAEGNVLLEAVLASAALDNVRDPEALLVAHVDEAPGPDMAFDAIMIASRLGMSNTATNLYNQTRGRFFEDNEGVDGEAEFLLAEAKFVVRMGIVSAIAVNEEAPEGGFDMDPVNKATMGLVIPGNQWSAYATSDATGDEGPQPSSATSTTTSTNPSSPSFENEDKLQEDFVTTPVFLQIAKDALPGLQSMDAWHSLDSFANQDSMGNGNSVSYISGAIIRIEEAIADAAASGDPTGITTASARGMASENADFDDAEDIFETTVAGLLHRVAFMYPGTPSADIAGAQIDADQFSFGDRAIPFSAPSTDGGHFFLSHYDKQAVLIEFSNLHDEDSMADRAAINDMAQIYGPSGLHVVRIYMNSAEDEWLLGMSGDQGSNDFVTEIYEGQGNHSELASLYGVTAAPTRIMICKGMRVFEAEQSELTTENLHDTIQNCLQFNNTDSSPCPSSTSSTPRSPCPGTAIT
ncbi:MAG: thioredoxin domain-containing protein [Planctomycetota bacterium]